MFLCKNYVPTFKQTTFDANICQKCLIPLMEDDGMFVCIQCGQFNYPCVNTYGDDEKIYNKFSNPSIYVRLNHFKEILHQLQGKETKRFPEDKFTLVQEQFKAKESVQENIVEMKKLLRKLKLNKYIKVTNNILTNLKVISPPVINENLFEILCLKFCDVESKFSKLQDESRTNMIPAHFLLFRIFNDLGHFKYLPFLSFTKNQKLLKKYNELLVKLM